MKRSLGDLEGDARRGTRRSFFRRKKQRSDSKELASFSNINLGGFSDSGSLNEETTLASYQKVTRLDCKHVTYLTIHSIGLLLNFKSSLSLDLTKVPRSHFHSTRGFTLTREVLSEEGQGATYKSLAKAINELRE